MIEVKIKKLADDVRVPAKQTVEAAAFDVYAYLPAPVELKPNTPVAIATGFQLEIPPGYFISLRPRSGLALKQGITLPNCPGTIDSDYRGEVKVILLNLSNQVHTVNHQDRIAQLLLEKCVDFKWQEAVDLTDTSRAGGGFGSTG